MQSHLTPLEVKGEYLELQIYGLWLREKKWNQD